MMFKVSFQIPWYADIVNYLACGVVPQERERERERERFQQIKKFKVFQYVEIIITSNHLEDPSGSQADIPPFLLYKGI